MKILFIPLPEPFKQPWYDGFVAAIDGRYPIRLCDPAKPLADQFQGIDVVVELGGATRNMIDAGLAAGVKLWQIDSTGLDKVNVAYFLEQGLPLTHTPGPFSAVALAEQALFLMLCLAKNFKASQQSVRSRVLCAPTNDELAGKSLGLIGLGASGRELAKRAWAMGMRTMAIDIADVPQATRDELHIAFFGDPSQLDKVLVEADYLSIHTPLTSRTRHMIDRRVLELMKPTAVLINVARGGIVDADALFEALQIGQIRGAGLDAFDPEPIDPAHPLLQMENVIITPHVAGVTTETALRRGQALAENVGRVAQGLSPLYQVMSVE